MAVDIDILHLFPELLAVGQSKLQSYSDDWLRRPLARECGISQIVVDEQLTMRVNVDAGCASFYEDKVFIPIDELLGYIIDRHFDDANERRELHARLRQTRQRWSELNRDYEATIGRAGTLILVCKNSDCRAILETEHRALEGQEIVCPASDVTCPACGQTNQYDGTDLKLKLAK